MCLKVARSPLLQTPDSRQTSELRPPRLLSTAAAALTVHGASTLSAIETSSDHHRLFITLRLSQHSAQQGRVDTSGGHIVGNRTLSPLPAQLFVYTRATRYAPHCSSPVWPSLMLCEQPPVPPAR